MSLNENEEILHCLEELKSIHYPSSATFEGFHGVNSIINQQNNELESIYNLVQMHSPVLRSKTVFHYNKLMTNDTHFCTKGPSKTCKENLAFKCLYTSVEQNIQEMLRQIEEMPKEWTIVQFTPEFNLAEYVNENTNIYYTHPINISVFNCGHNQIKPFLVSIDSPKDPVDGKIVNLTQEMLLIIKENKECMFSIHKQKKFKNHVEKESYFNKRQRIDDRLKSLIKDLHDIWLQEWRCLLVGKYCDENLETYINDKIHNYFKAELPKQYPGVVVTEKIEAILSCVVKTCFHLKLIEVKRAVQYCFPKITDKNIIKTIVNFLRNLNTNLMKKKDVNMKKHPVILVLHDSLDCFPWELLDVFQDNPVTRLPSLHFVHSLFKEHESNIVDGNIIIKDYERGTYIVNPDTDLKNMEIRMMSFFQYWTPEWIGTSGYQPDKEEFYELLTSSNIFSYNGHGSGSHLMSLEKIQKTHVKAVILLFGCGSTKLNRMDPQIEMYGSYHAYLIARCPCVVGMLWEVTDTSTDVLTTDFLSCWIPSKASIHWKHVDQVKWKKSQGELQFLKKEKTTKEGTLWEPELLRAICLAKKTADYAVTKAACVVRGLPVKIQE